MVGALQMAALILITIGKSTYHLGNKKRDYLRNKDKLKSNTVNPE